RRWIDLVEQRVVVHQSASQGRTTPRQGHLHVLRVRSEGMAYRNARAAGRIGHARVPSDVAEDRVSRLLESRLRRLSVRVHESGAERDLEIGRIDDQDDVGFAPGNGYFGTTETGRVRIGAERRERERKKQKAVRHTRQGTPRCPS